MAKRDLILHNFWWKVTSLLLAVIVWIVVHGTDQTNDIYRAPRHFPGHVLSVMRDTNDKRKIRVTPTEVDIIVTAPITEATRLTDSDIQTFVDLSDVDERHTKARIRVYVPRGVQLESITPDEATVEIIE
jgi:YbbR domain-containing protein